MAIYIERTEGRTHYVYGPFESETEARITNILSRPIEDTATRDQRVYARQGVCGYTKIEIECFSAPGADLEAYGYDRFVVLPAEALKFDESWFKTGSTLEWCREYAASFGK